MTTLDTPAGVCRRCLVALAATTLAFAVLSIGVAWATPPPIDKAKSQAAALRQQIDELDAQVEAAADEYDTANVQLEETKAAARQNEAKLASTQADLQKATARLTTRVVEIYKNGDLGVLNTLVGSASFSDLIGRLQLLERMSAQDRQVVRQVLKYRQEVAAHRADLSRQLGEEKQYAAQAGAAEQKVRAQLTAKNKALAGKEAQIAQLEKEDAQRRAVLAAEAKRAAEEAAKRAREEAARQSSATRTAGTGSRGSTEPGPKKPWTTGAAQQSRGAELVQYSMRFLGVPYLWGGYSTSGFDCSGFTKYVYAHFGISIPHSSKLQYGVGRPVSRADLQPGDLVFFYSPISHVGMYIGNGKMINSRSGGVQIDNAFWSSYVGARRILK